ncbi:DUF6221 family protein [Streptosporangium roseum]|uniref:DUF6221 family protein n=1 Tax=Streptosporangium roseum TaxID=2001 RepID=UPI0004CD5E66|nr:DUF6221 family protein [Streptosporangium roseum]
MDDTAKLIDFLCTRLDDEYEDTKTDLECQADDAGIQRYGSRTLRDIEAKRRTLARCQEEMLSGIPRLVHFATQTLKEMALPYANYGSYRPEWRL